MRKEELGSFNLKKTDWIQIHVEFTRISLNNSNNGHGDKTIQDGIMETIPPVISCFSHQNLRFR